MNDKEKVIKGLQCCSTGDRFTCELSGCPYYPEKYKVWNYCTNQLTAGALALLEEQEKIINELEEKLRLLKYGDQDILESGLRPAT